MFRAVLRALHPAFPSANVFCNYSRIQNWDTDFGTIHHFHVCVCVCVALGFYNVWLCVNTITIKIQSCPTTTGSPVLQLCLTFSGTSQTQEYIMNDSMYIMN